MTADRPPRTDAEWARDTNRRLDNVEHPDAMRAGPWVLSADSESGDLTASHVDGGSVRLAKVPASDADPDTVVVEEEDPILWENPILNTGWDLSGSPASLDPVKYRKLRMNGIDVIQFSGAVHAASGTPPGLIWTMPEGYRPIVNLAPFLVARGFGGGSVAAQIDFRADGTINLVGGTAGIKGVTATQNSGATNTGAMQGTVTATQFSSGQGIVEGSEATGAPYFGDTGTGHRHGMQHGHFVGAHEHAQTQHFHGVTADMVELPDFVSFQGIFIPL